jgi:hypothetical protein
MIGFLRNKLVRAPHLSHMNNVYIPKPYFFYIHFNIIVSSTLDLPT